MSALAAAAALLAGAFLVWAILPTIYVKYLRRNSLPQARRELLLSFDDGPDPRYTPQLLDLLAKEQVRALFFVTASRAALHPELIRRMREQGHSVGLHGCSHRNNWFLSPLTQAQEISRGQRVLAALGAEAAEYRPPYGNISLVTPFLLAKYGLRLRLWTVMVQDWRDDRAELLLERLWQRVEPGSVICLHDGSAGAAQPGSPLQTIAALQSFLPQAKLRGYRFIDPALRQPSPAGLLPLAWAQTENGAV